MEPVRIVITMEGGLIQCVCTLGVPVEAVIIDYDTDGADEDELDVIDQGGGGSIEAIVRFEVAEALDPAILASVGRFWPASAPEPDEIAPGQFERSIMAGYQVHNSSVFDAQGQRAGFLALPPEGEHVGHYPTEREAWEACDRHRLFGAA